MGILVSRSEESAAKIPLQAQCTVYPETSISVQTGRPLKSLNKPKFRVYMGSSLRHPQKKTLQGALIQRTPFYRV